MSDPPLRVGVLASGGGTNLQAILDRLHGRGAVEVVAVGSDKPGAAALQRRRRRRHRLQRLRAPATTPTARLATWRWPTGSQERGVELVVLAGYMQLLSPAFIDRFAGQVINVHPALLPSFPGLDAIGQAYRHGVRVSGVTVHFVDAGVDTGPIILQEAIELPYTRSIEEFEAEVHRVEHRAAAAGDRADRRGRGHDRRAEPASGEDRER